MKTPSSKTQTAGEKTTRPGGFFSCAFYNVLELIMSDSNSKVQGLNKSTSRGVK